MFVVIPIASDSQVESSGQGKGLRILLSQSETLRTTAGEVNQPIISTK